MLLPTSSWGETVPGVWKMMPKEHEAVMNSNRTTIVPESKCNSKILHCSLVSDIFVGIKTHTKGKNGSEARAETDWKNGEGEGQD